MDASQRSVAVVGDYRHFLQGFLRKALDFANIAHGPDVFDSTNVIIVWNPWSRLKTQSLVDPNHNIPTINFTHFNCAKSNVTRHFESTFEYRLAIDPRSHIGPMVKKSETNALHDGETIHGPIMGDPEPGFVYQRLVDNSFGPSIIDVRVMILKGVLGHCFVKGLFVMKRG